MADETQNQSPYEGEREDLFSFPEVEGLEEFGLVPTTKAGVSLDGDGGAGSPEPEPEPEMQLAAAKQNPPVPDSVGDLDEDLFSFDEIFSLDNDPFYNGTLTSEGKPTNPLPVPEPVPEAAPVASEPVLEAAAPAPAPVEAAEAAEAPAPAAAAAPAPQPAPAPAPQPAPEAAPQGEDLFAETGMHTGAPRPSLMGQPTLARDRGPRILLPEDVPYSPAGDHGKLVWALVVCFLLVNTGIFMLAHQASTNVNTSISEATGLLAQALSQRGEAPTYGSAPASLAPAVTHTVQPPAPAEPEPLPVPTEPWVDPRDYAGAHEFAVGNAKVLMGEGRFEDARRLLNHVLANQARVPLAPALREEIDYLIPLTYYEQGRSIAPEEDQ